MSWSDISGNDYFQTHKQEGIVIQIEYQARFVGVIVEQHRRGRRVETHQLHEPCGECEKLYKPS